MGAAHNILVHIFQPFGEKASSSVKCPIPEKGPGLAQLGSKVHTGTISCSQGLCCSPSADGEKAAVEGIGQSRANTTNGAKATSFSPTDQAHVSVLPCATRSVPSTLSQGLRLGSVPQTLLPFGAPLETDYFLSLFSFFFFFFLFRATPVAHESS